MGAGFGVVGVDAVAGEAPDDDDAGDAFDRAVEAVADQRDRVGADAGGDADRAFGGHPGEAEPGEQLDATDQRGAWRPLKNDFKPRTTNQNLLLPQASVY